METSPSTVNDELIPVVPETSRLYKGVVFPIDTYPLILFTVVTVLPLLDTSIPPVVELNDNAAFVAPDAKYKVFVLI